MNTNKIKIGQVTYEVNRKYFNNKSKHDCIIQYLLKNKDDLLMLLTDDNAELYNNGNGSVYSKEIL